MEKKERVIGKKAGETKLCKFGRKTKKQVGRRKPDKKSGKKEMGKGKLQTRTHLLGGRGSQKLRKKKQNAYLDTRGARKRGGESLPGMNRERKVSCRIRTSGRVGKGKGRPRLPWGPQERRNIRKGKNGNTRSDSTTCPSDITSVGSSIK